MYLYLSGTIFIDYFTVNFQFKYFNNLIKTNIMFYNIMPLKKLMFMDLSNFLKIT